ncbi:MAG: TIGR01244 family sulfur transferase [Pseudomonadota bacterium]
MQRRLNDLVTVSPQITVDDLAAIKAAGFRAVVAARPDGEAPGQPSAAEIASAAEAAGLVFRHVPMRGPQVDPDDVAAYAQMLKEGSIFTYCGAGPRAVLLTSLAEILNGNSVEAVIAQAAEAGFDLSPALPLLESYASERDGTA